MSYFHKIFSRNYKLTVKRGFPQWNRKKYICILRHALYLQIAIPWDYFFLDNHSPACINKHLFSGSNFLNRPQDSPEDHAEAFLAVLNLTQPTALPSVEDVVRAMHAEVCCPCDPTGCDVLYVPEVRYARAVLALFEKGEGRG